MTPNPGSRYAGLPVAAHTLADGRQVPYLTRRFLPAPERFALLHEHLVREGDRLDLLAAQYLGDPEQFWRLCDANGAMHPAALVRVPGSRLRITLPEGVPAPRTE